MSNIKEKTTMIGDSGFRTKYRTDPKQFNNENYEEYIYSNPLGIEYIIDAHTLKRMSPNFSPGSVHYNNDHKGIFDVAIFDIADVVIINKNGESVTIYITLDGKGRQIGFICNNILEGYCMDKIFTGNIEESIHNYDIFKRNLAKRVISYQEEKKSAITKNQMKFLELSKKDIYKWPNKF